jgi:hypothetical protein
VADIKYEIVKKVGVLSSPLCPHLHCNERTICLANRGAPETQGGRGQICHARIEATPAPPSRPYRSLGSGTLCSPPFGEHEWGKGNILYL